MKRFSRQQKQEFDPARLVSRLASNNDANSEDRHVRTMKATERLLIVGAATLPLLFAGCAGDYYGAGYGGPYYGGRDFYGESYGYRDFRSSHDHDGEDHEGQGHDGEGHDSESHEGEGHEGGDRD